MKILAIETSTMLGGVALADDKSGMIAETRLNVKTTHSERLMTTINSILLHSALEVGDIDAFAVAIGPGSFTGLRIGLSTAKGLSYATGKPIVCVPTFDAYALSFAFSRYPVCLMLDARKSEVYAAMYRWEQNRMQKVLGDFSTGARELAKGLDEIVVFAGEGSLIYRQPIVEIMGERALFAPSQMMVPSPVNVAIFGIEKALRGDFTNTAEAVPRYIRRSEAEVKWQKRP